MSVWLLRPGFSTQPFFLRHLKDNLDCGPNGYSFPSRPNFANTVTIATASTCDQCLVGCRADCHFNHLTGKCVSELSSWEWLLIGLAILLFLLLLALIFFCCCKGKKQPDKGKDENKDKEPEKPAPIAEREITANEVEQRKISLARQRTIEVDDAPPPTYQKIQECPPISPSQRVRVATINKEADHLVPVTRANAARGLRVVRGRSWEYGNQDGGKGSVGVIKMCVKEPNWWMVQWPNDAPHAYYVGEDPYDRCDLAVERGYEVTPTRRASLRKQRTIETEIDERGGSARKDMMKAPRVKIKEITATNPEAEDFVAVTRDSVYIGMKVVRGRSWEYDDQDGGKGSIGVIKMCAREPNWWIVQWPSAPAHAYYVGENEFDRCDLAVSPSG